MSDVTQILSQIQQGDPRAASELLPLVYDELRQLASAKMAQEAPLHTLQATALVHEAYLRLVGSDQGQSWDSRGHFFAAAAEAMRRILVESARRKRNLKHGGQRHREELNDIAEVADFDPHTILVVDESLAELAAEDQHAAAIVKLHFFAGLPLDEVADALQISRATVYRQWSYARAWLKTRLSDSATDAENISTT